MGSIDIIAQQISEARERFIADYLDRILEPANDSILVEIAYCILGSEDRHQFITLTNESLRQSGYCWDATNELDKLYRKHALKFAERAWADQMFSDPNDATLGDGESQRLRMEEARKWSEWREKRCEP